MFCRKLEQKSVKSRHFCCVGNFCCVRNFWYCRVFQSARFCRIQWRTKPEFFQEEFQVFQEVVRNSVKGFHMMPKHNLEVFCDFRNDKLTFQKNLKTFDEKCHFTHCTGIPSQNTIKCIGNIFLTVNYLSIADLALKRTNYTCNLSLAKIRFSHPECIQMICSVYVTVSLKPAE